MQKWKDRPPSEDAIDVVLRASPAFLQKHGSLLAKALPPITGFGIFLLYFYRNHFYPSFDLFQFSSLLLAAACIGFVIVGVVVVTMVLPGAAIFHWFINDKKIKEDLLYAIPYSEDAKGKFVWQLVGLAYFAPFCLAGLGIVAALVIDPGLFLAAAFLWPAFVALGCGIALQVRFHLPQWSFCSYGWTAYIAILIYVFLLALVFQNSLPIVQKLDGFWHYPILWAVPLIIAFMMTISSMVHFVGWSAAVHFGLFFGLVVAAYSGLLTTIPEKAVQSLGLGAYQAEIIMLDPAFCDRDLSELGIAEDCTLRNVHVVWSFGDAILLRPKLDEAKHVQIPTEFVRSIVQSVGRGK